MGRQALHGTLRSVGGGIWTCLACGRHRHAGTGAPEPCRCFDAKRLAALRFQVGWLLMVRAYRAAAIRARAAATLGAVILADAALYCMSCGKPTNGWRDGECLNCWQFTMLDESERMGVGR